MMGRMPVMFSACGFRCDVCPAFKDNVVGPEDQRAVAAAWKKYFDIDMEPAQIMCNGCFSELVEGLELPARECKTRDCVTDKGFETCAECEDYPCEHREATMSAVEKARDEHAPSMSPEEREKYFEPYNARKNFDAIRKPRD
jgi:Protein of unknown function (DUF3795)